MKTPGPLSSEEAEFLAVETSKLNQCGVCLSFHEPSYNKLKGTNKDFDD
jgi:AhpD family alkylhydroperoxidase